MPYLHICIKYIFKKYKISIFTVEMPVIRLAKFGLSEKLEIVLTIINTQAP
jgi:hypothetical protein